MLPLPHRYVVTATPAATGPITLVAGGLRPLPTAAPVEFDGPGGLWSPETLLVGAAADCFVITFQGVARASRLPWTEMTCEAAGTLDRVDGVTRFTRIDLSVRLALPAGTDEGLAGRVIDKAKRTCLITNSLTADVSLHATIEARTMAADGCTVCTGDQ